jgi:hypothetical protein
MPNQLSALQDPFQGNATHFANQSSWSALPSNAIDVVSVTPEDLLGAGRSAVLPGEGRCWHRCQTFQSTEVEKLFPVRFRCFRFTWL